MLKHERENFDRVVLKFLQVWEKQLNAQALALWWEALEDLALSDVQRGFEICVKHSRFAPKPGDIRRKVTGNESEGGTVSADRNCQHPGCNQLFSVATADKRFCSLHNGSKQPNYLQANWRDAIGAVRAIDKLGEPRARAAYSDEIVDAVLENAHNNYQASPATWTVKQQMRIAA